MKVRLIPIVFLAALPSCRSPSAGSGGGTLDTSLTVPPASLLTMLTIQGDVRDEATNALISGAVVQIDGQEVGPGTFTAQVPVNQEFKVTAQAVGYRPFELVVRPHLDPGRPRLTNAPIRLTTESSPSG